MAATAPDRRTLHFTKIDQALDDVAQLSEAEQRTTLRCCGNWTFGQTLNHLANWVDYSYDGAPMKVPFFVRWIMRPMKNQMLTKPMKPGSKIPRIPGGTLGIEVVSSAEGLSHFQKTFTRLAQSPPARPHLLFGRMTHDEWIAQHLRHAELHLSFLRAE